MRSAATIRTLACSGVFLGMFGLLNSGRAHAANIPASSCAQADIQSAVNQSSDGDTVQVPSGACTWTVPISFCKAITLKGAGAGLTVVTSNVGTGFGKDAIFVDGCLNKPLIRVTGFTFQNQSTDAFGLIFFHLSAGTNIRIDNNIFSANGNPGRAITVTGSIGVIDHNTFTDMGLIVEGTVKADSNPGDGSWTQAMSLGKVNAVYVEDNTMNYPTSPVDLDCDDGGRIVYRFNTINGNGVGNHGFDSVPRGCVELDAYNNTIVGSGTGFIGVQYRGGTGVVYNNLIQGIFTGNRLAVTNYRSTSQGFTTHDYCNGTSPNDQNTAPTATNQGWACRDQVGRGTNQGPFPLYQWNNCITALGCTPGGSDAVNVVVYQAYGGTNYLPEHIQPNRDYFESVASFNGTQGVGQGTLAARPSTCVSGTAYWTTDTNILYSCRGGWIAYYVPYPYPHPIQNGLIPPLPPTNLSGVAN